MSNFKKNCLSFLPISNRCKKSNYIEKIKCSVEEVGTFNLTDFQKQIMDHILDNFSFQEYFYFRKALVSLSDMDLQFASLSLFKIFQASTDEILLTLRFVSQSTIDYPGVEKTYNSLEKKYEIIENKIQVWDCYLLFPVLASQFRSVLYKKAMQLTPLNSENYTSVYDSIYEIFMNDGKVDQAFFLVEFDSKFAFLEDTLYRDFYHAYRDNFLMLLLKNMEKYMRIQSSKKDRKTKVYSHSTLFL